MGVVRRVVSRCRDGKEKEELPFIQSLLQNYDSEDKVDYINLTSSVLH